MPNTVIRIGVISDPAPMPVAPTSMPTASPAAIIPVLMSICCAPVLVTVVQYFHKSKRFSGECKSADEQCLQDGGERKRGPGASRRPALAAGQIRLLAAVRGDQHLGHLGTRELDRRHLAVSEHLAHLRARQ